MKSARTAFVALSLVALPVFGQATANTRVPAKMFTLVNATSDSVTAVAVSADSAAATIDVGLGEPLRGGLTAATVRLPAGGCVRAFEVTFANGATQTFRDIDVCRFHRLRLDAAPRPGA